MAITPSTADRATARARAREQRERQQQQLLSPPGRGPGRTRNRGGGGGDDTTTAAAGASAFDHLIPHIRVPKEKDLVELFQYKELDKILGQPTYEKLLWLRKQLTRNATKVESPFGGGKTGHAGMVLKPVIFDKKEGTEPWNVPESQGACPIYPAGATEAEKRAIYTRFVITEEGIIKAKKMKTLMCNQLVDSVEEDFIMELRDPLMEFDNRSIIELLDHLFKNHGELGLEEQDNQMERFHTPPDWNKQIDTYYFKQQECQEIMEDTDIPITDAMMVYELVAHVSKSGIVTQARQKWTAHIKKNPGDNCWEKAKIWFRQKIRDVRQAEKDVGQEGGTAFMASKSKDEMKAEIRQEILEELNPAMEGMAMAATARSNSADKNEAGLKAVNEKMDDLMSQNKRLRSELDQLKSEERSGKRVKFKEEEDTECPRERNSKGELCATKKGTKKWTKYFSFFVDPQWCEHCKKDAYHLPHACPTLPENKKKKEESERRRGVKRER